VGAGRGRVASSWKALAFLAPIVQALILLAIGLHLARRRRVDADGRV
jgi:hypothetical protein